MSPLLGFIISKHGIMADPDKVKVIRSMATPMTVREVTSFIGICGYYQRFILNFFEIATLLITLRKKLLNLGRQKKAKLLFSFWKKV